MLDAAEEALDAVAFLVEGLVVGVLALAVTLGRNDRVAALVDDLLEELVGVVGLVGEDVFGGPGRRSTRKRQPCRSAGQAPG